LGEHVHEPAIDVTEARYDTVTHHALVVPDELRGTRHDERIELAEGSVVQEQVHALARGQLALGVLLLGARFTTTDRGALPQTAQSFARTHAVRIGRGQFVASVVPESLRWTSFGAMRHPGPAMWSR
jgi:hypothetical protein